MLDFYILPDDKEKPEYDGEVKLDYSGGVELETFQRLQKQNIIDYKFDFYSDFRWTKVEIERMLKKLDLTNTEHLELKKILEKALQKNSGLITIAD